LVRASKAGGQVSTLVPVEALAGIPDDLSDVVVRDNSVNPEASSDEAAEV